MNAGPAPPFPADQSSGVGVAVVITTYNHAHFLADAIESVLAQTTPAAEILVVDDGSTDDPASVVAKYDTVRLISQANLGLAGARNTGLQAVLSQRVIFLDADDRLTPNAITAGLACFAREPNAAFVYGAHRHIDAFGTPDPMKRYSAIGQDAYADFLSYNPIGMHATVMYDRSQLIAAGSFDASLPRCEDYDAYLRLARSAPIASHPEIVAEYRRHGANMSSNHREMLEWVLRVHDREADIARQRGKTGDWRRGRRIWRDYYAGEVLALAKAYWSVRGLRPRAVREILHALAMSPQRAVRAGISSTRRRISRALPPSIASFLKRKLRRTPSPPLGAVRFGDLDRTRPISRDFGFDRGTPIDRFYIERFLTRHAADIHGRALEIGDDTYCRRFGGIRITQQDVLHVNAEHAATIVGNLSVPGTLPEGAFDCLVLTQTLHLIFDMRAAIAEMHRSLRPGGVLLLTVPGISQIDRGEWGDSWYWSLTPTSAQRLFAEAFGAENVEVEAHGNVFAAIAFLHGIALEEIDLTKLDISDAAYPLVVTVRARKAMEA